MYQITGSAVSVKRKLGCAPCTETSHWYHPIPLLRLISKDCSIRCAPGLSGCRRRHPNSISTGELNWWIQIFITIMSCMLNTATEFILNCTKFEFFVTCLKTFHNLIICHIPTLLFTSPLDDWPVNPKWSHHRAAVKPIKRWISATIYPGSLRLAHKSFFTEGNLLNTLKLYLIFPKPFVQITSEVLSLRYMLFILTSQQILFKSLHVKVTTYESVELHLLWPISTDALLVELGLYVKDYYLYSILYFKSCLGEVKSNTFVTSLGLSED